MPKSETSPHGQTPPTPHAGPSAAATMVNTTSPSEAPYNPRPPPLKRGDACLYCRKRRIRCSATKPSCHHCTKLKRECVYDSGKPTSRVRKLEDKVAELEGYLRAAHAANEQQLPGGMPLHASPHAPMHTALPHSDGIAPGTVHGLAGTPYMYPHTPARDGMVAAALGDPNMPGIPGMTPRMSYAETPSSHYPLPMVSTVGSVVVPGHHGAHHAHHYRSPQPTMQGHTAISPPATSHVPIRSTTPSRPGSVDAFPIDPALGIADSSPSGPGGASPFQNASMSHQQPQQQQQQQQQHHLMPRVAVAPWQPQFYPGNLHAPEISPSTTGRASRPQPAQVQTHHVMHQGTMPVSHGSAELHVPLPSPSTTSGIPTPPDASRFQPYVVDADRASSEPTQTDLGAGASEWDPKAFLMGSPELVGVGWLDANDLSPQARDQLLDHYFLDDENTIVPAFGSL